MDFIKKLREQRAARKAVLEGMLSAAETENRGLNETEDAEYRAIVGEIKGLDERIDDLIDLEAREAATAKAHVETGTVENRAVVTNEPNPVYRKNDADSSFFKDLFRSQVRGDHEARGRLARSQETRTGDLTTTAGAGGEFAPPLWLVEDFVALARPARVTADLMNKQTLPSGVSSINLPKVATGTTVAVQATQNTAVSDTALTTGSVSSGITTIAGKQIVAMQLLEQSGIPFDNVVLSDLALAYAAQVDVQVISGSGSSGQLRGLANGASVGAITYTSSSPAVTSATAANSFYNKVIAAVAGVQTNRYLPPTAIVMHPNRWAWVLEALDTATRPLVVPDGPQFNGVGNFSNGAAQGMVGTLASLPVYVDPNIPTNVGSGTNQDTVYVLRTNDCWLFETDLQAASFDATYADQMSILFRVSGYSAFIPDRYGKSVYAINGTGLVAPTL